MTKRCCDPEILVNVASRGIMVIGHWDAIACWPIDLRALQESFVGPLITPLAGLRGQLIPMILVGPVGLAGVGITGGEDDQKYEESAKRERPLHNGIR